MGKDPASEAPISAPEHRRSPSLEGREPVAWQSRIKYAGGWSDWREVTKAHVDTMVAEWGGLAGKIGDYDHEIRPLYDSHLLPEGYADIVEMCAHKVFEQGLAFGGRHTSTGRAMIKLADDLRAMASKPDEGKP